MLTKEYDDAGDGGWVDAGQDAGQDGAEPAGIVTGKAAGEDVGDALEPVGEEGGPAAVGGEGVLRAKVRGGLWVTGSREWQRTCVRESPRIRTLDHMIPQLREQGDE